MIAKFQGCWILETFIISIKQMLHSLDFESAKKNQ